MATETDPVCGMQIDQSDAAGQSEFGGSTYFFCSTSCKEQFDDNPRRYLQEQSDSAGGGA